MTGQTPPDAELSARVALLLGWRKNDEWPPTWEFGPERSDGWPQPKGYRSEWHANGDPPRYAMDLDLCAEMEASLDERERTLYVSVLLTYWQDACLFPLITMPARARALAFLTVRGQPEGLVSP